MMISISFALAVLLLFKYRRRLSGTTCMALSLLLVVLTRAENR